MAKKTKKISTKRSLWAYVLPGLVVVALIGGALWLIGAKMHFEKKITALLKEQAMTAEETHMDWLGNYVLRNVRGQSANGPTIVIGEVRGHLSLFDNDTSLRFRNVRYESADMGFFIPEADIEQLDMPRMSAAGPGQDLPPPETLLSAGVRRLVISELSVRQLERGVEKQSSYRNVELRDMRDGKIGYISGGSIVHYADARKSAADDAGEPQVNMVTGPFEVYDFNLGLYAMLYSDLGPAETAQPGYQQLHGRYRMRNIASQAVSDSQMKYHVEEISGNGLSIHLPGKEAGTAQSARNLIDETGSSPIAILKFAGPLTMDVKGFTVSNFMSTDAYFDKVRINYDGKATNFVFDNLHVLKNGVKTKLANLVVEQARFPKVFDVFDEVSALSEKGDTSGGMDLLIRTAYALVPQFASLRAGDIMVDKQGQNGATRILALEKLNVKAQHQRGAMPTGLRVEIDRLQLPVGFYEGQGLNAQAVNASYLKTLGYNDYLDSNLVLDYAWDEEKQQIMLNSFSSDIADLGSFRLWGTIGNVNDAFFTDNPVAMAIAVAGFRIRDVHLSTDKDGLWQRVVVQKAEQTGKSPEEIRSQKIFPVHDLLSKASGTDSQSVKTFEPVFDYLKTGGVLTVDAVSRNPKGVGVYEFIFDPADPYRWLENFNLKANRQDADRKG